MNASAVGRRFAIGRQIRGFCNTPPPPLHKRGSVIGLLTGLYRLHANSWQLEQERIRLCESILTKKSQNAQLKIYKQKSLGDLAFNLALYRFVGNLKLNQALNRQEGKDGLLEYLLEREKIVEKMRFERKKIMDKMMRGENQIWSEEFRQLWNEIDAINIEGDEKLEKLRKDRELEREEDFKKMAHDWGKMTL